MWIKKQTILKQQKEKEKKVWDKHTNISKAEQKTKEAQQAINRIENTLLYTLKINDAVDWEKLKDFSKFKKTKPELKLVKLPEEPVNIAYIYQPQIGILELIFKSLREKEVKRKLSLFEKDYGAWTLKKEQIEKQNEQINYKYAKELKLWEEEKRGFL